MEFFACDYPVCKGCCCIIGDSGAPLKEEELEPLEANYEIYSPLMTDKGRAAIDAKGFFEIDRDGDLVTPVVPGSEECAYCHFEADGSCFCAIERQFCKGLTFTAGIYARTPMKKGAAKESVSTSSFAGRLQMRLGRSFTPPCPRPPKCSLRHRSRFHSPSPQYSWQNSGTDMRSLLRRLRQGCRCLQAWQRTYRP